MRAPWRIWSMHIAITLRCVLTTPFARPVVPLV